MGIPTIRSYTGAQIFETIGLDADLADRHFHGTTSRIGRIGIDVLAREALLPPGGLYRWRRFSETHMWSPDTIASLQRVVRGGNGDARTAYAEFARLVNEDVGRRATLRGLMRLTESAIPVPLDEVEPAAEIVKRFSTGAMSLGSLSPEAHETLAIAMNRIGGKSNTGEGGRTRGGTLPTRVSRLCGCLCPGQAYSGDFFVGGLVKVLCRNSAAIRPPGFAPLAGTEEALPATSCSSRSSSQDPSATPSSTRSAR